MSSAVVMGPLKDATVSCNHKSEKNRREEEEGKTKERRTDDRNEASRMLKLTRMPRQATFRLLVPPLILQQSQREYLLVVRKSSHAQSLHHQTVQKLSVGQNKIRHVFCLFKVPAGPEEISAAVRESA